MMIAPRSLRRKSSGQTLLLGVVALVILCFSIFFLFDLQSLFRTKIRVKTGVDAAAIVGANWQRYTLNMIGDINLIKSTTAIINDMPGSPGALLGISDVERLRAVCANLSQLQQRILFVGPMIGWGAAQQAAAYNGLEITSDNYFVNNHISFIREGLYSPPNAPKSVRGFNYSEVYESMVSPLKLTAVQMNSDYMLSPSISSDMMDYVSVLLDKDVYEAINRNYWCGVRHIIRKDYPPGWWGRIEVNYSSNGFPAESEYLPVGVTFSGGIFPQNVPDWTEFDLKNKGLLQDVFNRIDPLPPELDPDKQYDPLPRLEWAVFKNAKWREYSSEKVQEWRGYLRSGIKPHYCYSGCYSVAYTTMATRLLSNEILASKHALPNVSEFAPSGGAGAEYASITSDRTVNASALAKPLGHIKTKDGLLPPMAASGLVLPCFETSALVPVALEDFSPDDLDQKWIAFVTEYLPTLGRVGSLEGMNANEVPVPEHWPWFLSYHNALIKLSDPNWRERGIRWLDTPLKNKEGEKTGTWEDLCVDRTTGGSMPPGPSILH